MEDVVELLAGRRADDRVAQTASQDADVAGPADRQGGFAVGAGTDFDQITGLGGSSGSSEGAERFG